MRSPVYAAHTAAAPTGGDSPSSSETLPSQQVWLCVSCLPRSFSTPAFRVSCWIAVPPPVAATRPDPLCLVWRRPNCSALAPPPRSVWLSGRLTLFPCWVSICRSALPATTPSLQPPGMGAQPLPALGPAVARLLRQYPAIRLDQVRPTGKKGRVLKGDVLAAMDDGSAYADGEAGGRGTPPPLAASAAAAPPSPPRRAARGGHPPHSQANRWPLLPRCRARHGRCHGRAAGQV